MYLEVNDVNVKMKMKFLTLCDLYRCIPIVRSHKKEHPMSDALLL